MKPSEHAAMRPLSCSVAIALLLLVNVVEAKQEAPGAVTRHAPAMRDGQHDFDFEVGSWKTTISRLQHPLSGSSTWVKYDGTTVVRKVWNGRAILLELEADGPAGHFQGLSLRLYNPESHQWSLNFANSNSGTLGQPTIGEFKDGRGEFYDQEQLDGRAILVRFVISGITADSVQFEQAFSADGGKSWEVNWIATDTRIKGEVAKAP
jgi:hypothetical protein